MDRAQWPRRALLEPVGVTGRPAAQPTLLGPAPVAAQQRDCVQQVVRIHMRRRWLPGDHAHGVGLAG